MRGYVYLIGSKTFGWYKIGRSSSPHIRLKNIGILLPFRVEGVGLWGTESAEWLESHLQEKFASEQINGEWFKFEEDRLKDVTGYADTKGIRQSISPETFSNLASDCPDGYKLRIQVKKDLSKEEAVFLGRQHKALRDALPQCPVCGRRISDNNGAALKRLGMKGKHWWRKHSKELRADSPEPQ